MAEFRISSLSYGQMEKICEIAEEAARKIVTSRVPSRGISDFSVSVDLEGTEPLSLEVDVEITLSPLFRNVDVKELTEESIKAAFAAVEEYLGELGWESKK